ncbi:chalcone isomerase family protein [Paraferrimonas sp. SM1919]|uniref:chalcone isomerase family protein n=1 Tax=Paraferrimonas sp. SM1919 TaxID=2662263 RepID=UPI0013D6FE6D|nr:chalcone isomerase family protein [Paraferrimonas sp. SM1919]
MIRLITLMTLALTSHFSHAITVSDVELKDNITIENQSLALNGAGIREKLWIDLYVGSLYTAQKTDSAQAVIAGQQLSAIRLNIVSGMITSEKMSNAVIEGFENAMAGDYSSINTQVEQFLGLFSEEIVEGDQFTFISKPGVGITSLKNGKELATIEGEDFRQAVLKIWLGDEPAQESLKEAMLGQ